MISRLVDSTILHVLKGDRAAKMYLGNNKMEPVRTLSQHMVKCSLIFSKILFIGKILLVRNCFRLVSRGRTPLMHFVHQWSNHKCHFAVVLDVSDSSPPAPANIVASCLKAYSTKSCCCTVRFQGCGTYNSNVGLYFGQLTRITEWRIYVVFLCSIK